MMSPSLGDKVSKELEGLQDFTIGVFSGLMIALGFVIQQQAIMGVFP